MNAWEQAKRIVEELEARAKVREFVARRARKLKKEAMGSGNSTSQGDDGGPEETEVERTY